MKAYSYFTPPLKVRPRISPRLKKILVLLLAILCLTSVFGYRFYSQPQLAVDTISPITIIAPRDGQFEDRQITEEKRQKAKAGVPPIIQRNEELTLQIKSNLATTLDNIEVLKKTVPKIPFVDPNLISKATQNYLITCSPLEWQIIFSKPWHQLEPQTKAIPFNKALSELKNYEHQKPQDFQALIEKIEGIRHQYLQSWQAIKTTAPNLFEQPIQLSVLKMSEENWQKVKPEISRTLNKILMQGLPEGLPSNHLQDTIDIHLQGTISPLYQSFARELLLVVLQGQYNLEEDREATQQRAIQAGEAVQPEMVAIEQGETIVKAGEKITQENFVLLDNFELSRRRLDWKGLGISCLVVIGTIGLFCLVEKRIHQPMRQRDHLLLCLLSISTPLLAIAETPYTNLAALGLLASSFYGPTLAIVYILLVSSLSHFALATVSWPLLAGTAGGILAAAVAGKLRSRDELALLGAGVGLTQSVAYLIIYLIASATAGSIWFTVLPHAIIFGLSGLLWCIVALGLSPYLERFFDLVTPIRLVELANLNRPLLQRLVTEAPGTFQHTLFVSCLAEAAARKLHCNVELVRTGTLYHDIGKMHDPQGFIENQMDGINKHDRINDPWISAEIIKKHISEGLIMARKYGLPKVVRDFIPEHQGTLQISYFYHQAKATHRFVDEEDFRYDGPIPQSRETGIVMLADSCEAALRSLKNATPDQAKDMINKIFAARWRDNQLKDSGLRREELKAIAEVFIQVWQQYNHQRIAYPKAVLEPKSVR